MQLRPALLMLFAAALFGVGGCPSDSTTPTDVTVVVDAPTAGSVGQTITLTARVSESIASGARYVWYQTFGPTISLLNSNAAIASFVAPSLRTEQRLYFRVDVFDAVGTLHSSQEISIRIAADPEKQPVGGTDGGSVARQRVLIETSLGEITVELNAEAAPITVDNFLRYVDEGFYTDTIWHRVIPGFVIQGGGFTTDLMQKTTHDPIALESANGLSNLRGTIAMARTGEPNSATSQFFINLVDNLTLDRSATNDGYAVFGRVVDGLSVVDAIAAVPTQTESGFQDVPVTDVLILAVSRIAAEE